MPVSLKESSSFFTFTMLGSRISSSNLAVGSQRNFEVQLYTIGFQSERDSWRSICLNVFSSPVLGGGRPEFGLASSISVSSLPLSSFILTNCMVAPDHTGSSGTRDQGKSGIGGGMNQLFSNTLCPPIFTKEDSFFTSNTFDSDF